MTVHDIGQQPDNELLFTGLAEPEPASSDEGPGGACRLAELRNQPKCAPHRMVWGALALERQDEMRFAPASPS